MKNEWFVVGSQCVLGREGKSARRGLDVQSCLCDVRKECTARANNMENTVIGMLPYPNFIHTHAQAHKIKVS